VAAAKQLSFAVDVAEDVPAAILTDEQRLQQILKNLLSNAFKFTEHGEVRLRIERAATGWSQSNMTLNRSPIVVAFRVIHSGIGIPAEKHNVIFEAFQQAGGGTTRKYSGTGLGLSISRVDISRIGLIGTFASCSN
jgi:signal transduction histidine kinase